jgi:hypothetical protein
VGGSGCSTLEAVTIEVSGLKGESLIFDGATVARFRHDGLEEAARNPASSYREVRVKARKRKGGAEQEYDVMLACSAIMSLRVTERPRLNELFAALEAAAAG